ncbi:MAG: serine hydrolase [Anaerolineae bacterium]|nr:MAG: serine hydrolase [Anaerolineae bacterium]
MRRTVILITLALTLLLVSCGQPVASPTPTEVAPEPTATATTRVQVAFSYASPESQGLSAEALEQLADMVRGYVEGDKIVGAELLVIKNRQVVLHKAVGWKDLGDEIPLERNTLFNIRSMTKPVVGTAIQMLIEEGKLALDDPVAKYLPSFDNEQSGDITVEHLLTHRSGLPLTMIAASFGEFDSLRALADGAGERGPDFEPGTAFQYSDTGSDVLGALVEVVSGVPLQQFVQERILDPLGMADTVTLIEADDPRTDRIASLYFGGQGEWSRIWSPTADEPLYPFAMGSQSLYTTPLDYARFLAFWMDGGRSGDQQLLSAQAVERALTSVSDSKLPGSFPGLRLDYGQMWIVYVPRDALEGKGEMALFGHSGSDGTWAWVWPDLDLTVLYFTQSRGQGTGIGLEDKIDHLLIHPGREEVEVPDELEPYLGTYTALSGPLMYKQFGVLVQNGRLAVNLPEQIVVELEPPDDEGKWAFSIDNSIAVSFVQDEAGQVTALKLYQAGEVYKVPRGKAPPEPELALEDVQKYLGIYYEPEQDHNVEVVFQNGRLGIKVPDVLVILELYPPDAEGKWHLRLNPEIAISFNESQDGHVESFTSHTPEGDFVQPRVENVDSQQ